MIDITDERERMKAYNFIEGMVWMFENKEEGKRILKMNLYYYLNEMKMPILFDI